MISREFHLILVQRRKFLRYRIFAINKRYQMQIAIFNLSYKNECISTFDIKFKFELAQT